MYRACVLPLLLILGACGEKTPADGAIRVSVQYGSYAPACLRVLVRDTQGHEGRTDILQSQFQKPEDRSVLVAVFRRPEWERALTVEVSSFDGSAGEECAGTLVEQHTAPAPITVPLGAFARFDVMLRAQDADGDTFVKKEEGVAGTDCEDGHRNAYPGAPELCSVAVDFDCDGFKGCQDSQCQDKACDDDNACTTGERCLGSGASATCAGGLAMQCDQPTDVCFTRAECVPATGQCANIPAPPETGCDDGNPCTVDDRCGPEARCAGTSKSCNTPLNACYESTGTCNTLTGECSYPFKPAASSCNDADACTVSDVCNGAGVCGGSPTPCTASSSCHRVISGCTALGNCMEEPDPSKVNTACMFAGGRSGVCRAPDAACSTFPYVPSNFNPDDVAPSSIGTLTTTCAVAFDSGTLSWNPPSCVSSSPVPLVLTPGAEMVLLPVSTLSLGGDLRLVGTRPVILAVYGDATLGHSLLVNGFIDTGGTSTVPGAGGNQGCTGRRGSDGLVANGVGGGGGGAGGGTAGAAGNRGNDGASAGGGAGGAGGSGFAPLAGGCPGGNGGGGATVGGRAGAGGGALQLSVAGTLTVTRTISASGSGGLGGRNAPGQAGGGGGGGSGGQVLLEAHQLNLADTARLTANGGGAGEGAGYFSDSIRSTGANGEDGLLSSVSQAGGGRDGSTSGGEGGNGGAAAGAPAVGTQGESVLGSIGGGGGGGGAVGHIRLRSVRPCSINSGSIISPETDRACPL